MDDEEFKVFLGVVILIGACKSNNESVAQLCSTLDGRFISNRTMSRKSISKFYAFSDLTMHNQDDIIGSLTSCNQSEKCLKLGTFSCMIPTPADEA